MNNLANVSTDGFRREIAHIRQDSDGQVRRNTGPDLTPGSVRSTGRDLDVAVSGEGWMAIAAPDGTEAYSRRGDLRVDEFGQLMNGAGHQVLGNGGPISLPPYSQLEIGTDGTVSILPEGQTPNTLVVIDRIKLVNPAEQQLVRGEDGLFRLEGGAIADADAGVRLLSGSLEGSNVNAVESLVTMIDLARSFETQVQMMKLSKEKQEHLAQLVKLR